jgi:catechol 2,3-dioxygenase
MQTPADTAAAVRIHPDTALGAVRLTVSDLDRARTFYERAIGLRASEQGDGTIAFGVIGESPLIELRGDSSASPLDPRATGLYHLAILVPTRRDLAVALARLAETSWPLDGASDHLVSEALYLSDPDGNGIEIYRDRPRDEWRRERDELQMATLPLDLPDLVRELPSGSEVQRGAPAGTKIGHVHLRVSELRQTEAFYHGVLGFDVVVRSYPGAVFVSAGGYHHHIGLNTWQSAGAAPPKPGSVGLRNFDVTLPSAQALEQVLDRVRVAGIEAHASGPAALVRDPSGNGILLRAP